MSVITDELNYPVLAVAAGHTARCACQQCAALLQRARAVYCAREVRLLLLQRMPWELVRIRTGVVRGVVQWQQANERKA